MKTLKQHYEAINELLKDENRPLDEYNDYMLESEVVDLYFKENEVELSKLEDWELDLFKSYTHYLCIMSDGWY